MGGKERREGGRDGGKEGTQLEGREAPEGREVLKGCGGGQVVSE